MSIIVFYPECPKCGCRDIRKEFFGYRCFKCGHFQPRENPMKDIWPLPKKEAS